MVQRWTTVGLSMALVLAAPVAAAQDGPDKGAGEHAEAECEQTFTVLHAVPEKCLEDIDTDRPHKTDTPHTVPAGHVQVEAGIAEYEIERWSGPSENQLVLANNIYTLGLADNTRGIKHASVQVLHSMGSYRTRARNFGFSDQLMVRTKLNLVDGPLELTLVPAVVLPLKGGASTEAGGFVFLGGELPLQLDFELNVGATSETDPETGVRHAVPVVTTAFTRKIAYGFSAFVELYNETSTVDVKGVSSTFDTGFLFTFAKNWQLDGGAYIGTWGSAPRITPFLGISSRI